MLGQALKIARIKKGWTQDELSEVTKISRVRISDYETERTVPRKDRLKILVDALDVELAFVKKQ